MLRRPRPPPFGPCQRLRVEDTMSDPVLESAPRSRRALLAAAAGVAAAAAATIVVPATALATDPDDVVKSQDNATTAVTSITQSTADTDAFQAHGLGDRLRRRRDDRRDHERRRRRPRGRCVPLRLRHAAVRHRRRRLRLSRTRPASPPAILADGPDRRVRVRRLRGLCRRRTVGVFASAAPSGTAVHAHAGAGQPPAPLTNVALLGTVTSQEPGRHLRAWPGGPPRP